MKLIRYGDQGKEKPGIVLDGSIFDLSEFTEDFNEHFFESGGLERLCKFISNAAKKLSKVNKAVRIGCPVARPSKIVAVGLNYLEHIAATGLPVPKEPVIFLKATSAICGPYDTILLPPGSEETDWETELAVIIGKRASYISQQDARGIIAGYSVMNDISERSYQLERGGTVDKGKGCNTFCPIGPYLVTPDEIEDPNNLAIWLKLNGKMMQNSSTKDLYFKIPFLISYISQFMTLLPGDIIATGTPSGTGHRQSPPVFLKSKDVLEYGIDNLGIAKQTCRNTSLSTQ
ncbi:fumarylacetoacetate hydrolase family protein [Dyadobacter frigoris]|uniref:Fumarylacetoacetate hydrolase family protein n=1 Tax=Dyadobacter frigoris TaxID=2576211 RepID=A0A4U6CMH8_9BACT|nr:fumarylacetoacetate hydrolase family protein [Dyadobacter frigoris]TKT84735.1 fumarylacetoacetate hydrolase family protein [Dyadobacter frigoris]GLU57419.1 ureidoglycolate lyase [Dyadobacter frigoris]